MPSTASTQLTWRPCHLGHQPGPGHTDRRGSVRTPMHWPTAVQRVQRRAGPALHRPGGRRADRRRARSSTCSSARAPTRASRTCATWLPWCADTHRGARRACDGGARLGRREGAGRSGRHAAHLLAAGFEWRQPGCSMCLAMNDDVLAPGQRCASTTNRNFEGRQGRGAITHLMSPAMAAAAAVTGRITDVRQLRRPTHV